MTSMEILNEHPTGLSVIQQGRYENLQRTTSGFRQGVNLSRLGVGRNPGRRISPDRDVLTITRPCQAYALYLRDFAGGIFYFGQGITKPRLQLSVENNHKVTASKRILFAPLNLDFRFPSNISSLSL